MPAPDNEAKTLAATQTIPSPPFVVPWDEQGRFVEEAVPSADPHARRAPHARTCTCFGTGGEGYGRLGRASFAEVAAAFADEMPRRGAARPMLGVISLSLTNRDRADRARLASSATRRSSSSLPSWGPARRRRGSTRFFPRQPCARASPEQRFPALQTWGVTKRILRGADYRRLAEAHPNLVAVKFSSSDLARRGRAGAGRRRRALCFLTEQRIRAWRRRSSRVAACLASIVALDLGPGHGSSTRRAAIGCRRLLAELELLDRPLARGVRRRPRAVAHGTAPSTS